VRFRVHGCAAAYCWLVHCCHECNLPHPFIIQPNIVILPVGIQNAYYLFHCSSTFTFFTIVALGSADQSQPHNMQQAISGSKALSSRAAGRLPFYNKRASLAHAGCEVEHRRSLWVCSHRTCVNALLIVCRCCSSANASHAKTCGGRRTEQVGERILGPAGAPVRNAVSANSVTHMSIHVGQY